MGFNGQHGESETLPLEDARGSTYLNLAFAVQQKLPIVIDPDGCGRFQRTSAAMEFHALPVAIHT